MDELAEIQAGFQRRRDLVFLALLALMLAAVGWTVWSAVRPARGSGPAAAGEIRRIEPAVLRALLGSGHLSDHEAAHYRRVGAEARP
jgi:hypothetical protein